ASSGSSGEATRGPAPINVYAAAMPEWRCRRNPTPRTSNPAPTSTSVPGSGVGEIPPAPLADKLAASDRLVPTNVETFTDVGNCTLRLSTPPLEVKMFASNPPVRLRLAARLELNEPSLEPEAWEKFSRFSVPDSRVPVWPLAVPCRLNWMGAEAEAV